MHNGGQYGTNQNHRQDMCIQNILPSSLNQFVVVVSFRDF